MSPTRSLNSRELALALGLAHFLHDDVLRGLRGDAAEIDRRQRIGDEIADLRLGIEFLRRVERDLRRFVLDRVGDLAEAHQLDLAVLAVDLGADVVFLPVFGAAGFLDRLLHRLQHFVAIDALVARDRVGNRQQLRPRIAHLRRHGRYRLSIALSGAVAVVACPPRSIHRSEPVWRASRRRAAGAASRLPPRARPRRPPCRLSRPRNRLRPSIGSFISSLASKPAIALEILRA